MLRFWQTWKNTWSSTASCNFSLCAKSQHSFSVLAFLCSVVSKNHSGRSNFLGKHNSQPFIQPDCTDILGKHIEHQRLRSCLLDDITHHLCADSLILKLREEVQVIQFPLPGSFLVQRKIACQFFLHHDSPVILHGDLNLLYTTQTPFHS